MATISAPGRLGATIAALAELDQIPESSLCLATGMTLPDWCRLKVELLRSEMITESTGIVSLTLAGQALAERLEAHASIDAKRRSTKPLAVRETKERKYVNE